MVGAIGFEPSPTRTIETLPDSGGTDDPAPELKVARFGLGLLLWRVVVESESIQLDR
jgi:hypothetical protein